MSYQRFIGVGNLTRDPELRYSTSGTAITTVGIAFNRRFRQGDEQKEEVCFIDVVAFGKTAENFSQYCHKGHPVLIEGRLQQRRWENEDGTKHSKHEVVVDLFRLMAKKDEHEHVEA